MASIFGIIMNHALYRGVAQSDGVITMKMMNKLSDAANVTSLPAHLIPQMRSILHNGLQNIMLVALILMLVSFSINIWGLHLEKQKMLQQAAMADK